MLLDEVEPLPEEAQARVRDALRRFRTECFWSWGDALPAIDRAMAREVVRELRRHGGKPGWRAAADLVRCL